MQKIRVLSKTHELQNKKVLASLENTIKKIYSFFLTTLSIPTLACWKGIFFMLLQNNPFSIKKKKQFSQKKPRFLLIFVMFSNSLEMNIEATGTET